jgi:hypothetical protein
MFNQTTYRAAGLVMPIVEAHFAGHPLAAKILGEEDLVSHRDAHVIEAIIDIAFWASLRKEEGRSPKISIALLPPDQAEQAILFQYKIVLDPEALTKLAPGVERPGIHVGVWYDDHGLYIWGTTHNIPDYCFVLDVSEPALLVIKHRRREGFGKFVNVAVLKGDQVKVIDQNSAYLPDCPSLLSSLLGFSSSGNKAVNVLIQLAVSMRSHKQGGLLLVVPEGNEEWRESILHPMKYSVMPGFSSLKELLLRDVSEKDTPAWLTALDREIESIAGLTAIDGATVITASHELLAFGAKIIRPPDRDLVGQILTTEPVIGNQPVIANPSNNGGTRHMSAAQFVHDQRDAWALVASQDGHFTIFAWSACEGMVHAHRLESLLI